MRNERLIKPNFKKSMISLRFLKLIYNLVITNFIITQMHAPGLALFDKE